jgi:hypothetical protein
MYAARGAKKNGLEQIKGAKYYFYEVIYRQVKRNKFYYNSKINIKQIQ